MTGIVYTHTVVYAAPMAYVDDAPYQIAIVDLEDGKRVTGRIQGDRVDIGDRVQWIGERDGVPFLKKI